MTVRQVHRNKASLTVSWDIKLARQGRGHHGKRPGTGVLQLRWRPELKCNSWVEGQRPWAKLLAPRFAVFTSISFRVPQLCHIRADFEPKQLNSWQSVYGVKNIAMRVGALRALISLIFISLSFTWPVWILLCLLWPCCETNLECFSSVWSRVSSLQFTQAAPPFT